MLQSGAGLLALAWMVFAAGAVAQTSVPQVQTATSAVLQVPKGRPILEVTGRIGAANKEGAAIFDRDMLEGFGLETVKTRTL